MIESREITDEQPLSSTSTLGDMLSMIAALDQGSPSGKPEVPEESVKLT
ncbi:hypothetical protein K0504_14680 [Neiella marina]|uniref:Uncharacterized protein n=1 Tax=Neiella holothuriorum TaxID=2870530 RepID=A0ABS7EIX8_9GAMM|nr:hypothetical protein [Neiella holothuriorum]MBW8192280.1 hypothetical protein [Neiella holothuriorum]